MDIKLLSFIIENCDIEKIEHITETRCSTGELYNVIVVLEDITCCMETKHLDYDGIPIMVTSVKDWDSYTAEVELSSVTYEGADIRAVMKVCGVDAETLDSALTKEEVLMVASILGSYKDHKLVEARVSRSDKGTFVLCTLSYFTPKGPVLFRVICSTGKLTTDGSKYKTRIFNEFIGLSPILGLVKLYNLDGTYSVDYTINGDFHYLRLPSSKCKSCGSAGLYSEQDTHVCTSYHPDYIVCYLLNRDCTRKCILAVGEAFDVLKQTEDISSDVLYGRYAIEEKYGVEGEGYPHPMYPINLLEAADIEIVDDMVQAILQRNPGFSLEAGNYIVSPKGIAVSVILFNKMSDNVTHIRETAYFEERCSKDSNGYYGIIDLNRVKLVSSIYSVRGYRPSVRAYRSIFSLDRCAGCVECRSGCANVDKCDKCTMYYPDEVMFVNLKEANRGSMDYTSAINNGYEDIIGTERLEELVGKGNADFIAEVELACYQTKGYRTLDPLIKQIDPSSLLLIRHIGFSKGTYVEYAGDVRSDLLRYPLFSCKPVIHEGKPVIEIITF